MEMPNLQPRSLASGWVRRTPGRFTARSAVVSQLKDSCDFSAGSTKFPTSQATGCPERDPHPRYLQRSTTPGTESLLKPSRRRPRRTHVGFVAGDDRDPLVPRLLTVVLPQESEQRVRELRSRVEDNGCSGRCAARDSSREGFRCAGREQQAL
jgi:hypothetical protein